MERCGFENHPYSGVPFVTSLALDVLTKPPKSMRVRQHLTDLMDRMRRRWYPETMPVLAWYWLKTVYGSGYERAEWQALDKSLEEIRKSGRIMVPEAHQAIQDLRDSIQKGGFVSGRGTSPGPQLVQAARPSLNRETLLPYIARLLNEWLPLEVSYLLVGESSAAGDSQEEGIPCLARAQAVERLLRRGRLSASALELLLQDGIFPAKFVYPADLEILRDVALFLLGRTEGPRPGILPATLLWVAPDAPLPTDYHEAVARASFAEGPGGEELYVPLAPGQAREVLRQDQVRIGSVAVTVDGRWWHADALQTGEPDVLVYRPVARLRIDDSHDHARLRIPWPETHFQWPGAVSFAQTTELFGRQWRIAQWDQDAEHTWLTLEFTRTLPLAGTGPMTDRGERRSRPASVDIAWTALENALAASVSLHSTEPIEQLRQHELIPLGRAVYALAEAIIQGPRTLENLDTRLRAIRYMGEEVSPDYGRVPWRVLPEKVRRVLLGKSFYATLAESLQHVFEGIPRHDLESSDSLLRRLWNRRNSPSHAA